MAFQQQLNRSQALNSIPTRKYEEKVLTLVQSCLTCSKKGIRNIDQLDGLCSVCSINVLAYKRYYDANIPISYWAIEMDKFAGSPNLLKLYKEIDIKTMYGNGDNYFLVGTAGTGKTTTAANILKLGCQKNYNCVYTMLSDIVSALTEAPYEDRYVARKELITADFVIIDEVDPRFAPSEHAADLFGKTLEIILRTRLQNKIPTILVSNSPNPEAMFSGSMKASLGSLYAGIKVVVAVGKDYRKENK